MDRLSSWAEQVARRNPWTNVYGTARSLIAAGTFLTLVLTPAHALFLPSVGRPEIVPCDGFANLGFFCQFPEERLELARWMAAAVLLLVMVGWRPRVTGILHWYIAWSFMISVTLIDGGDQIAAILTLLLVPVTLLDSRTWHWSDAPASGATEARWLAAILAISCLVMIRVQVAIVYLHAAVGKMAVEEWLDGTVLYYWFRHPYYGASDWLAPLIWVVLDSELLLPLVTWSVLILEALLFAGLIAHRRWWPVLLALGAAMHLGIALIHGIVSFSIIMWGALILYLRPFDRPFGSILSTTRVAVASLNEPRRRPRMHEPASAPESALH